VSLEIEKYLFSRAPGATPVVLAIQEAEIRRTAHSSKPAWANSSRDPISKRAGGVAQGVGLKFKPQYHKKKK
jgi:hypothetical protein